MSELQSVIVRLNLISQASAMRLDGGTRSSDTDIGGNRPPGGIDRKGDREEPFRQKSAEYFARRAERCRTEGQRIALLKEAEDALYDWQHTPTVQGKDPEVSSLEWKRMIGASQKSAGELGTQFGVSRQYIQQVRKAYS